MADESPAPPPGTGIARNELRASHQDRDRIVEVLRVAAGDGRLTADELDQRLELALTARTYGELAGLIADLPAGPEAGLAPVAPMAPKELVRIETRSGSTKRDGRWIVPQRMEVRVTSGSVRLDFTSAVFTQPVLRIAAEVGSGNLTLITKPGIVVDTDDVSVRSGDVKVRTPWGDRGGEVLRIEIAGKVSSGNITARPPRRTFWEWLLRRPFRYELTA
jgi:hypothetical protein